MPKSPSSKETPLKKRVTAALDAKGILNWSVNDALIKGLPDRQGIALGVPFHIEFKAEDGKLEKRQEDWLRKIARAGGLAIECRVDSEFPKPFYAKYRFLTHEAVPEWTDYQAIRDAEWLNDLVYDWKKNQL